MAVLATPAPSKKDSIPHYHIVHYILKILRPLLATLLLPTLCFELSAATKKERWVDGANSRKADYIYLQALAQNALDDYSSFYTLMSRAVATDAGLTAPLAKLGTLKVLTARGDSASMAQGFDMVEQYFELYPDDYYSGRSYAMLCSKTGNTERMTDIMRTLHARFPDREEASLLLVDVLINRCDTAMRSEAAGILDTLIMHNGYSLPLITRRTMIQMAEGDTTQLIDDMAEFMRQTPRSAESRLYAAEVFENLNMPDSTLKYLDQACQVDSTSGIAFYSRGIYYLNHGDTIAYDTEINRAMQLPDLELETKLEIMTDYLRKLYTDSLARPRIDRLFAQLTDQYPHEPSVNHLYASYYVAIKDFAHAAQQQELVVDGNPTDAEGWHNLISLLMTADKPQEAVKVATEATVRFPDNNDFAILGISAALSHGDIAGARQLFKPLNARLDSLDHLSQSSILSLAGDIEYKAGNVEKSIEYYDRSIQLNPDNALALNNLAYYLACQNRDITRAMALIDRALSLQPENASYLDTYAWVAFRNADYKTAAQYLEKAFEALLNEGQQPSAEMLEHAGDISFMNGDTTQAVDYWTQALKDDPDNKLLKKKVTHRTFFYE